MLHHGDADLTSWPYWRRRAALHTLFADYHLDMPLTLCPSTTDPAVATQWLHWTAAGVEGLVFKRLDEPYPPVRSWRKYKVRVTTEAIVGAVTGTLAAPRTVLLGRYDRAGRLQYTGRSTPSPRPPEAPSPSCSPRPGPRTPGGVDVPRRVGHTADSGCVPGAARRRDGGGCRCGTGCGRAVAAPCPGPSRPHRLRGSPGAALRRVTSAPDGPA
ncbi:hypothetical protein ACFV28_27280 [Streptomyces sp. NPDC059720]|uniref:hypothetical protein n=1 Tax=Streptomyces sp. NPDC059720 TaxID=3346924 RepID=UPI0036BA3B9A